MKILFDTNIVLDVLLDRKPFADDAAYLFAAAQRGDLSGYLCSHTITTIYYLAKKAAGHKHAQAQVEKLLILFEIAPVNRNVLAGALASKFDDFEDAVVHEAGMLVNAHGIVTRDDKGFKGASISVYSPAELAHIIRSKGDDRSL